MKTSYFLSAICAAALLTGCATESGYVDSSDTTIAVKNKDRMSSSDWVVICNEMANRMMADPNFSEYLQAYKIDAQKDLESLTAAGEKFSTLEKIRFSRPLLMLSEIKNNTGEHIDTKLMTERLSSALFNSQKVRVTNIVAGAGQHQDNTAAEIRDLKQDSNFRKSSVAKKKRINAPTLALQGVIVKQTAQSGRSNELSYFFSLTLTDLVSGEGVWKSTKEIKRQHKQGVFGW